MQDAHIYTMLSWNNTVTHTHTRTHRHVHADAYTDTLNNLLVLKQYEIADDRSLIWIQHMHAFSLRTEHLRSDSLLQKRIDND